MSTLFSRIVSALSLSALIFAFSATAQAGDPPRKFADSNAREMYSRLKDGQGWAVISERSQIQLVPGAEFSDVVKYRVITAARATTTSNGQFVLTVDYSDETPWIILSAGMPATSGTAADASNKAHIAIKQLDVAIAALAGPIANEEDAQVRLLGQQLIRALEQQRDALTDLVEKELRGVKTLE